MQLTSIGHSFRQQFSGEVIYLSVYECVNRRVYQQYVGSVPRSERAQMKRGRKSGCVGVCLYTATEVTDIQTTRTEDMTRTHLPTLRRMECVSGLSRQPCGGGIMTKRR